MEQRDRVVGEEAVFSAGEFEVVVEVVGGLGRGEAGEFVAQRDALVERGEAS